MGGGEKGKGVKDLEVHSSAIEGISYVAGNIYFSN